MALTLTGCAKQVHEDYPQYLVNNQGQVSYPYVGKPALYYIDDETDDHAEKIKSWLAGIANSWTVRMGDVLDATLRGEDMQASFASLARTQVVEPSDGLTLLFHLNSYEFADFRAYVDMTIEGPGGRQAAARQGLQRPRTQPGRQGRLGRRFCHEERHPAIDQERHGPDPDPLPQ